MSLRAFSGLGWDHCISLDFMITVLNRSYHDITLLLVLFYICCSFRVVDEAGYSSALYCTLNRQYRIVTYSDAAYLSESGGSSQSKLPPHCTVYIPSALPAVDSICHCMSRCLQLLDICWNLNFFLEILEISWNLIDFPDNFCIIDRWLFSYGPVIGKLASPV